MQRRWSRQLIVKAAISSNIAACWRGAASILRKLNGLANAALGCSSWLNTAGLLTLTSCTAISPKMKFPTLLALLAAPFAVAQPNATITTTCIGQVRRIFRSAGGAPAEITVCKPTESRCACYAASRVARAHSNIRTLVDVGVHTVRDCEGQPGKCCHSHRHAIVGDYISPQYYVRRDITPEIPRPNGHRSHLRRT